MNEFERRTIEVMQNHRDIVEMAAAMGPNYLVEWFAYSARIGSTAAPLVATFPQQTVIAIQSDAYFVLQYISTCVLPILGADPLQSLVLNSGNILLQITDTGAGEILYSQASPAGILTGTTDPGVSGIPILLPIPRVIPPNTNIKVEMTKVGTSATNPNSAGGFICLMGARIARI